MSNIDSVLVTGATGNQGRAVVDALLESDRSVDVYGLTRDASSGTAEALADRGVEMVEGDLSDPDSFREYAADADGVFLNTNFWTAGYDGYVDQMTNGAEVAAEEGVDHLVYSSIANHETDTGVPHFDATDEVERRIDSMDVPSTAARIVFYYQNFEAMADDVLDGTIALPMREGVSFHLLGARDIGRVASQVFEAPEEHAGEYYDLAGEELTLGEVAEILSDVTGTEVQPYHVPIEGAREEMGDAMADQFEWFNEVGFEIDTDSLEAQFGEFQSLEEYLVENGWEDKGEPVTFPGWAKAMQ